MDTKINETIQETINAPITFNFNELSGMVDDKARLAHIRTVLMPYFNLAVAKINIVISAMDKKHRPSFVNSIDIYDFEKPQMSEFDFTNFSQDDKVCQYFNFDVEVDHCVYFNIGFNINDKERWNLCVVENDMGNHDTPPSSELVDIKSSENFIEIIDALVLSYKNQIDHWIDDEMEADRYEQLRDLEERNGRSSLPEDIW